LNVDSDAAGRDNSYKEAAGNRCAALVTVPAMDEKEFKKHLRDLAHGHHNPAEHDWEQGGGAPKKRVTPKQHTRPKARKKIR